MHRMFIFWSSEKDNNMTLFACTTKEGEGTSTSNLEIKCYDMFKKLYDYIQGENLEGLVMNMTAPISTHKSVG